MTELVQLHLVNMLIREYRRSDAIAITKLFYQTVRSVNLKDYSENQVRAWAPMIPDAEIWHSRMCQRCTFVAEENGKVIGFAELENDGHLDMFYCRHDFIRRKVGTEIYAAIESKAVGLGLERIFADVSITARPFFEHCGFVTMRKQTVTRSRVELTNFRMEKRLRVR